MNYTLFDLFLNAYNGNSFAQLQIVQRFQPLLKKYAALLKYEDAYSDLQLYLLELLHSGKLTKLQRKDDGTLVKYIESSIRHQYISLNSRKNAVDSSVIASIDEIDFDQMSLSSNDEYPKLLISDLHCNGVQREHNKKLNNGLPILHKVPPKRDYGRYFCIMAEKGGTSHGGLTEKLSPFFHAKKQEVNAYGR